MQDKIIISSLCWCGFAPAVNPNPQEGIQLERFDHSQGTLVEEVARAVNQNNQNQCRTNLKRVLCYCLSVGSFIGVFTILCNAINNMKTLSSHSISCIEQCNIPGCLSIPLVRHSKNIEVYHVNNRTCLCVHQENGKCISNLEDYFGNFSYIEIKPSRGGIDCIKQCVSYHKNEDRSHNLTLHA